MNGSRSSPAWAYALTFALVASTASTLAVLGVVTASALLQGRPDRASLEILISNPLILIFSWTYGLMPAGLTGLVASLARRGGTRRRFMLICLLTGGATSALFCFPWDLTPLSAVVGAAYGGFGALIAALTTRQLVRRTSATA